MDSEQFTVVINGESVRLNEIGKAQASRLVKATKFLSVYAKEAMKYINVEDLNNVNTAELLGALVGSLDEDALMMLGEIVSNKDRRFVEENFDAEWVIDGVIKLLATPPFMKLRERFFGSAG